MRSLFRAASVGVLIGVCVFAGIVGAAYSHQTIDLHFTDKPASYSNAQRRDLTRFVKRQVKLLKTQQRAKR